MAGVLFAGLAIAHFGAVVNAEILQFIRELGLLLFVYTIGLEIGPRFVSSMKNNGLKLNLLSFAIVALGVITALAVKYAFNLDPAVAVGILCGAVTNTPGLGAAGQLAGTIVPPIDSSVMGMSYAIAYPCGIIGLIVTMILIKLIFKINPAEAGLEYEKSLVSIDKTIESIQIKVTNSNIFGKTVSDINLKTPGLIISRIKRGEYVFPATEATTISESDIIIGICEHGIISELQMFIGKVEINERVPIEGNLAMKEVLVTKRKLIGRTVGEIGIYRRYPANLTRIFRGEFEIIPNINSVVQFGDVVRIVGSKDVLDEIALEFGNSTKRLDKPNVMPIFIGIVLGIIFGSMPIYFPGLSVPAKLGLAGGPLIVAIILGNIGRVGRIDFYVTRSANLMLREIGIVLFLACVGLLSGGGFVQAIVNGGYAWIGYGALITVLPIFLVGVAARLMRINYLQICGLLAGALTDPPALEYANSIDSSHAQALTYATVYPFTMLLRIITAQIFLLLLI